MSSIVYIIVAAILLLVSVWSLISYINDRKKNQLPFRKNGIGRNERYFRKRGL
ncbi:small membrane protein [Klebsiella oxytoca]|uniref:small membrane protein n=1 Tax=Klebsiella oxytoca TaxID=571 RepID=UPI00157A976C|nr:small membrane protein [Klebsiella oxytoca]